MPSPWLALLRRRRLSLIVLASLLVLLPIGCAKLEQTERELVFRIEPGTARWFSGLPAGVEDGTQMRLSGKGETGPGGAGDAIVTIEVVPHRFFTRDGDDVRLELPITLSEAVLGGAVKAPTVEKPVMLTIAPGATSGKTLRLKGKGFHKKGGGRGDQLVTLLIDVPADDAALKAFVADWSPDNRNPREAMGV